MAFNPNDDEPVWDLVDFRSRGNEVSPFRGRVKDQLMSQFSHNQSRQVNILNQHFGNNVTNHFYFGQPSPQSNTTRTSSEIRNSHPDHDDRSSERSFMSRHEERRERSNSSTRRESEVASQNDDSKCKVCLDNSADCVIYSCGHVVCDSCGQRLRSESSPCHICRQPIQDIVKIYR